MTGSLCSLIKSQTDTVEMEVFIVPEKREITDKNTLMLYFKKKPNLSLNKSRITFSLFYKKKDTIAVGCFIGFSKSSVSHTFIENSLNSTF